MLTKQREKRLGKYHKKNDRQFAWLMSLPPVSAYASYVRSKGGELVVEDFEQAIGLTIAYLRDNPFIAFDTLKAGQEDDTFKDVLGDGFANDQEMRAFVDEFYDEVHRINVFNDELFDNVFSTCVDYEKAEIVTACLRAIPRGMLHELFDVLYSAVRERW